jgi:uncharacterized membrane protein YjjB (DUF3815 family)
VLLAIGIDCVLISILAWLSVYATQDMNNDRAVKIFAASGWVGVISILLAPFFLVIGAQHL